jgi:hypothetical protein
MSISGKVGAVFVQTSAAPVAFTDQATTKNGTFDVYYITDRTKAYWDKPTAITVKKNSITVPVTNYDIEYAGGYIKFKTPNITSDVITASGAALTVSQSGGFFNWSADLETDTADSTTFASNGWKESIATVKGFSGSAEGYWGNSDFFNALGKEVVIALYVDNTANKRRYEGFGIITSDSIETAVDDLVNESIEIQGTGSLYYREG